MNNTGSLGGPTEADAMLASALLRIRSNPEAVSENNNAKQRVDLAIATSGTSQIGGLQSTVAQTGNAEKQNLQELLQQAHGLASSSSKTSLPTQAQTSQVFQGNLAGGTLAGINSGRGGVSSYGKLPLLSKPAVFPSQVTSQELVRSVSDIGEGGDAAANSVRNEQIEAALRSKPQRGRKRNNLNQQERLELTRTRNREHAKSTRIRKKARYQELEKKEAELHSMQESQKLESGRRQSILDFLTARELQFSKISSSAKDAADTRQPDLACLTDLKSFAFEGGQQSCDSLSGLDQMKLFDETLARRLKERFGADTTAPQLISYSASSEGIALSLQDTAFVEIDVLSPVQEGNVNLLSAIMQVKFTPKLETICSVSWHTTRDSIDEVSLEPIGGQFSHPSVVSLDPAFGPEAGDVISREQKPSAQQQPVDADAGPGMNI